MNTDTQNKHLRITGLILLAGLVLQLITFIWIHPITFMMHLTLGGLTTIAGIVFYLIALTRR